ARGDRRDRGRVLRRPPGRPRPGDRAAGGAVPLRRRLGGGRRRGGARHRAVPAGPADRADRGALGRPRRHLSRRLRGGSFGGPVSVRRAGRSRYDAAWAAVAAGAALGIALYLLVLLIERIAVPWADRDAT